VTHPWSGVALNCCDHPGVQAEEGGWTPAAAPSKAALKRARKKAAAAAANAAAAAGRQSEEGADGPTNPSTPSTAQHSPAAAAPVAAAADMLVPGAKACALPAAAAAASADRRPDCAAISTTGLPGGMQQLRVQTGPSDGSVPAAPLVPGWMVCPLTRAILDDPVLCTGDGQSYERSAIRQWLAASDTSPVTGQPLVSRDLVPNRALRSIIQAARASTLRQQHSRVASDSGGRH
jgi:U-box domain